MQLNELQVIKNGKLLRSVPFKQGLNLIVNSESNSASSGNSVGKSTPSRLIDYLFLSSGEDIFTEPEFKKLIPEVVNFIQNNKVLIRLSFNGFDKRTHIIARTLCIDASESEYYIAGEEVEKSKYVSLVSEQIFGQHYDKPSLRNISHKFIRNTNRKMQNTTRFLHPITKPDVYDQLYLFLFAFNGLSLLKDKADYTNKISTKRKHLAAYRNPHRESVLNKMIKPLKVEELEFEEKIKKFDFRESQETSVQKLAEIQSQITEITVDYSKSRNRLEFLKKSIANLKSNTAKVDGEELNNIYQDAGVSINGRLKRSYEDLVVFHNKVVSNKINLIRRDAERVEVETENIREVINRLHERESSIFVDINEPDTLKAIGQIYNDLSSIKEQIARVSALLDKIENTKIDIKRLEEKKTTTVELISENSASLDKNVEDFNVYFGALSKSFYGDRYLFDLEFDTELEKCRFDITSVTPNPTGGKKKGELSAFDLAYISFVNDKKLKRPTFVIHDSIEDVDANQVFDIFENANQINGQYIVALLRDKISDQKFSSLIENSVILELSETDKFFKIG